MSVALKDYTEDGWQKSMTYEMAMGIVYEFCRKGELYDAQNSAVTVPNRELDTALKLLEKGCSYA